MQLVSLTSAKPTTTSGRAYALVDDEAVWCYRVMRDIDQPWVRNMSITDRLHQACYGDWIERQLAKPIDDPFEFAYKATERELGKRKGWPAVHAATMGMFAGVGADVLAQTGLLEVVLHQGQWVGSGPAFVVGVLTYALCTIFQRTWYSRLDYHALTALKCN